MRDGPRNTFRAGLYAGLFIQQSTDRLAGWQIHIDPFASEAAAIDFLARNRKAYGSMTST